MTTDQRSEAINTVARGLLAKEFVSAPSDLYLDDIEMTDEDARAVVRRVHELVLDLTPADDDLEEAVDLLGERFAGAEEGPSA